VRSERRYGQQQRQSDGYGNVSYGEESYGEERLQCEETHDSQPHHGSRHKPAKSTQRKTDEDSYRGMSSLQVSSRKQKDAAFDEAIPTLNSNSSNNNKHASNISGGDQGVGEMDGGMVTEAVSGEMGSCRLCKRSFFIEKLSKHESVCPGIKVTKRDPKKSKVGALHAVTAATVPSKGKSAKDKRPDAAIHAPIPKWKRESDQLKQAMRAARVYASKDPAAIAAMPHVPSEPDPDLVPCPHCNRRFAASTAERHIPHCKNMAARPKRLVRGQGGAGGGNKGAPVVRAKR